MASYATGSLYAVCTYRDAACAERSAPMPAAVSVRRMWRRRDNEVEAAASTAAAAAADDDDDDEDDGVTRAPAAHACTHVCMYRACLEYRQPASC